MQKDSKDLVQEFTLVEGFRYASLDTREDISFEANVGWLKSDECPLLVEFLNTSARVYLVSNYSDEDGNDLVTMRQPEFPSCGLSSRTQTFEESPVFTFFFTIMTFCFVRGAKCYLEMTQVFVVYNFPQGVMNSANDDLRSFALQSHPKSGAVLDKVADLVSLSILPLFAQVPISRMSFESSCPHIITHTAFVDWLSLFLVLYAIIYVLGMVGILLRYIDHRFPNRLRAMAKWVLLICRVVGLTMSIIISTLFCVNIHWAIGLGIDWRQLFTFQFPGMKLGCGLFVMRLFAVICLIGDSFFAVGMAVLEAKVSVP